MILIIDTTDNEVIKLALAENKKVIDRMEFKARREQSEKLLPGIDKLLKKNKLNWRAVKLIKVANRGGSFTSLRIGVATANALGYALRIKVAPLSGKASRKYKSNTNIINIVVVNYSRDPDITVKKVHF